MRHLNGITPRIYTAVTDATGVATFPIPAGRVTKYEGCIAVPVAALTAGRMTVQITSEPTIGANLYASGGTITAAVSSSNTITSLLITLGAAALVAGPQGLTVRLFVVGE